MFVIKIYMDGLYQENWVFFGMVADNTSSEMTSWDPRPSSRRLRILVCFSYKSSRDLAPPSRGLLIIGPTPHTSSHSRPIHNYQLFDFLLNSLIHPIKAWIFHGSMPHPSLSQLIIAPDSFTTKASRNQSCCWDKTVEPTYLMPNSTHLNRFALISYILSIWLILY